MKDFLQRSNGHFIRGKDGELVLYLTSSPGTDRPNWPDLKGVMVLALNGQDGVTLAVTHVRPIGQSRHAVLTLGPADSEAAAALDDLGHGHHWQRFVILVSDGSVSMEQTSVGYFAAIQKERPLA